MSESPSAFSTLGILARIALRNLVASRLKTIIVGGIVFFGALLVVVGSSLLDSIDLSMSRSIIGSIAGHIQVYSSESKDELVVMGGFSLEGPDLAQLDRYEKVRETIMSVPNVAAVVPMGISGSVVTSGNTIDLALAHLRDLARRKLSGNTGPGLAAAYEAEKGHVRQMIVVLQSDLKNIRELSEDRAATASDPEAVKRAAAGEFWAAFDADPLGALEFLENRIAPQATDADLLYLRYVGTDPAAFAQSFDRMYIVDGTTIAQGKRGFLFSKYMYEEQVKLKTARRLDKIKEAIGNRGARIGSDPDLKRFVKENSTQVRELVLQLDVPKTALFVAKLQKFLGNTSSDVAVLLAEFFRMSDANFGARYRFFYDELGSSLQLYRIRVGDILTIKAFTRGGYVQSVNLRVWGTYDFKGLEKSPQAGALNLMDMVSFRELYGFHTAEREHELAQMKAASGAKDVARENAEAELFSSKTQAEEQPAPAPAAARGEAGKQGGPAALPASYARSKREDAARQTYDPAELGKGVVLSAAVILKNPRYLQQTMAAIETAGKAAGLPLRATSWQEASGIVGQFVTMMRVVLYTAVLIIFVVALVIINNALVMATLERVREIGTLRAVGAQRSFIVGMLLFEALVLGAIFGALGTAAGAGVIGIVGKVGIPAFNDIFAFFFSGPRLFPFLAGAHLAIALAIVIVVSAVSSIYPAWLAMRVTPRQAMQSED